ncbi:MAG: divalent metal cation transporter [Pseudomonadota bacterium]
MAKKPDEDSEHAFKPGPTVPSTKPRLFGILGPGLITGASDDDPSGIGTYSQTGAAFGYSMSWMMLFTYPLMSAVQIASARLGRSTGHGIAGNLARHYPNWLLQSLVALLLIANTLNIGADLGAMADATRLLLGGWYFAYVVGFGLFAAALQIFVSYKRYVLALKWLTMALFAYVAALLFAGVDWGSALRGMLIPTIRFDTSFLTTVVAVLGTTISPYLFFWQASEEAEDIKAHSGRHALRPHPEEGPAAIERIKWDTLVGMAFSNAIAVAIILTTAATLNQQGITDIQTSADAAEALRPIAGTAAFVIFAAGIVGTGLLAIPVLAGSAAYALGEARRWPVGLDRKPRDARAFYATILVATLAGIVMNFVGLNPIKALFWSAVVNGVVSVPVLSVLMLMTARHNVMGKWILGPRLRVLGWIATGVMGACVAAMLVTLA